MAQIPGYWEEYPPTAGGGGGGTGTVTNIATSSPITGGPITTTGTIGLANSGVANGTYGDATHVAQFTVDVHGLLTFAGNVAIAGAGTPGGSNKQVQYNNAGAFGGDANFTWDSGTVTLTVGSSGVISLGSSGVLNLATGTRILGDFSNATHGNRTLFQTATAGANTIVGVIPNGASTTATELYYSNSNPNAAQSVCRIGQSGTISVLDYNVINAGVQGTLEIRCAAVSVITFSTGGFPTFNNDTNFNGNIGKIRGVNYVFPSANATGILTNDGSGTLSWSAVGTTTVTGLSIGQGVAIMAGWAGP